MNEDLNFLKAKLSDCCIGLLPNKMEFTYQTIQEAIHAITELEHARGEISRLTCELDRSRYSHIRRIDLLEDEVGYLRGMLKQYLKSDERE